MCNLERLFPLSFFNIIVHLVVHLAEEAKIVGPIQYRWIMYSIERYGAMSLCVYCCIKYRGSYLLVVVLHILQLLVL